jgi:DNA-binding transcriptional regulator YdaS (Cro superfamily)
MDRFDADAAMALLRLKCRETSVTRVAERLGYSRTSVSLAVNGRYPGNVETLLRKVAAVYGNVECPYLGREIPPDECVENALRPCPTHNPMQMRHWRACQDCASRPQTLNPNLSRSSRRERNTGDKA